MVDRVETVIESRTLQDDMRPFSNDQVDFRPGKLLPQRAERRQACYDVAEMGPVGHKNALRVRRSGNSLFPGQADAQETIHGLEKGDGLVAPDQIPLAHERSGLGVDAAWKRSRFVVQGEVGI